MKADPAQLFIDLLTAEARNAAENANYIVLHNKPCCAYGRAWDAIGIRLQGTAEVPYELIGDGAIELKLMLDGDLIAGCSGGDCEFDPTAAKYVWKNLTNAQVADLLVWGGFERRHGC